MAIFVLCLVLFLAMMTGHSSGTYCVCRDGVSESQLQKSIDYACGNGADCGPILQRGGCYNPDTVKDHCNYAVNSYYQRKGQAVGTCDFSGTATVTQTIPNQASGCVYPASPSTAGTPSTTINNNNNPTMSGTPTLTGTTGGTTNTFGGVGVGPSGSGMNTDTSGTLNNLQQITSVLICSLALIPLLF